MLTLQDSDKILAAVNSTREALCTQPTSYADASPTFGRCPPRLPKGPETKLAVAPVSLFLINRVS